MRIQSYWRGAMGLRVKILGRSGAIGQVHERVFKSLGCEIVESGEEAVSICSPSQFHLDYIFNYFGMKLAVFCEKPLFWESGIRKLGIETDLEILKIHPNRRLFLNTPNTYLLDAVKDRMEVDNADTFSLSFHTQGKYNGKDIGVDLLPHGISMILHLFGKREISNKVDMFNEHSCWVKFEYGNVHVNFNFHEIPGAPGWMSFGTNGHKFYRKQQGEGDSYRVWMRDGFTDEEIEVVDPFYQSLERFVRYCKEGGEDGFELAADNMRLMGEVLL
jgi:predicted dehydrogenase